MPAFNTPTGIPYPRVHLQKGVLPWEVNDTCTAGAGTLLLEFAVLSRLTGNPIYEKAAKKALLKLWELRTPINLVGNTVDIQKYHWKNPHTGIGAGVDSFYEYLLKAYILLGDSEYLHMFEDVCFRNYLSYQAYAAVMRHIKDDTGFIYKNVNVHSGEMMVYWIDSLAAFFPGLQVLHGDLENAIKHHAVYFAIWSKYGALPERYNWKTQEMDIANYPLRPELFESTFMLYQVMMHLVNILYPIRQPETHTISM